MEVAVFMVESSLSRFNPSLVKVNLHLVQRLKTSLKKVIVSDSYSVCSSRVDVVWVESIFEFKSEIHCFFVLVA